MADISKITVLDGTTYNIKDATARGSIPSAATATPLMDGTATVGTATKYAREDHKHPTDTALIVKNETGNTTQLRQKAIQGVADVTVRPLINQTRANHLAFLPADQIIVEKTTDGGTTWVDAGFTDNEKRHIFAETRAVSKALPQINGKKNILCGLRFTITGMKYNVPSGTAETGKYAYWNSTYVQSCERYFQLNNLYFWISSSNDTMSVKVERATGANPNSWSVAFENSSYYMNGWSGADYIALTNPSTFGGGTGQTSNHWNWRITLMTRGVNGTDTMGTGYETQTQTIMEIRGYGDSVWTKPNEYMGFDKIYTHDIDQNVTFPAKVTANGGFVGNLTGNASNVTGIVAIANGGTGKTTANDAANVLLSGLPTWTADPNDNTYLLRQDTGGSNSFGRVKFSTVWSYILGKINSVLGLSATSYGGSAAQVNGHTVQTDVPANAVFTDTNNAVTQTATSTSSDYEVLFSATADNTTRTEGARKNSNLKFNPNTGNLQATQLNGVTIGSSPKFTDTTYESKAAASGGTAVSLVTTGEKYTWNNKSSLTLGTTSSTAYRGDYGNAAYTHGVTNKGSAFSSGMYKITTNSEGHVTAATAVQKSDITALGIPAQDTTYTPASADPIGPKSVAEVGTSAKYAREDHVHPTKMVPIATKTYTNVIATNNDNNGGGFFYLKVRPTTYNSYWHVKTRVVASISGYANYYTDTTFDVFGFDNAVSWYSCLNKIKSTSYRPIYYNSVFLTNSTGYNNSCGHWIGINLYNSTKPTSSSYKRTLEVELLACDNCTAELQNSLVTPTNIPNRSSHTDWYTSTNTSYSNYDAYTYGLRQSGDSNTTSISNLIRNNGYFVADSAVYRYQMLFQKDTNTLTPLNNTDNTTGTSKTMLTNVEFNPFGFIHYYASTTTVSAAGNISGGAQAYAYNGVDLRYTFNCGTTLTAHRPFYLVVTPTGPESCKIASSSPWTQTLPATNDGKWYIYLGRTYSTYQLVLYPDHPVYFHDGTSVKQMLPPSAGGLPTVTSADNGKILNVASGAWAKSDFTLDDIFSVVISETEPTSTHVNGWIDPSPSSAAVAVPQINDSETNSVDTYSSSKINSTYLAFGVSQTLTEGQMTQLYANMGFPSNTVGKLGYTVVT